MNRIDFVVRRGYGFGEEKGKGPMKERRVTASAFAMRQHWKTDKRTSLCRISKC